MDYSWILEKCFKIENEIKRWRRAVHNLAEVGFDTQNTQRLIVNELNKMGLFARFVDGGVVCEIQGTMIKDSSPLTDTDGNYSKKVTGEGQILPKSHDRKGCVLLRADIDALPIAEMTELEFGAKNGNMHACGHDIHTASLLGAAFVLADNRDKFSGTVKLAFQSAEEILSGAKRMIEAGVLENPSVDECFALHVVIGTEHEAGTVVLPNGDISAPYADFFKISVFGEGGHGAVFEKSKNAALSGAAITVALEKLVSESDGRFSLSVCQINSGNAPNVIPERCEICGSIRALHPKAREAALAQIEKACKDSAAVYGCTASVDITSSTEALFNNENLIKSADECLNSVYQSHLNSRGAAVTRAPNFQLKASSPSEDFASFAIHVPSLLVGLCAGKSSDGFSYPLHNSRAIFDERALPFGAAIYTALAVNLLNKQNADSNS